MGFTNRVHIKKLIFRTLSKYLVYRISMNIFSEEPFLSPDYLYGQYPPSQSYLPNKASWLIPLEKYVWGIISPPSPPLERPTSKSWSPPLRGGRSFSFPLFFIRLRLYVAGEELPRTSLPFSRPFFIRKKKLGGNRRGRGRSSMRGLCLAWGLGRGGQRWGWASGKTKGRPG